MIKKEKLLRYVVSNFVIVLVVGGIFVTTLLFIPSSDVSAADDAIRKGSSTDSVSLMINVYWGTEYIQPMLDTMRGSGVKATFFVGGSWAEDNEEVLKSIYIEGHEIGSHGYLHKSHSKLSRAGNYSEIDVTHKLVKGILGIDMNLFAPPSGDYSAVTVEVAKELGYKTILWTEDTIDWRDQDKDKIYKRATEDIKGGNLILMHPTAKTAEALPDIISKIKSEGYSLRTVSEVL